MEKTQYSAARLLILVVMLLSIAVGAVTLFAGFIVMENARTVTNFWLGLAVGIGGFLFAAIAYALYEFFKAFLDLVDNSHVIKRELLWLNKSELKSPAQKVKSHAPEETADRREQIATTSSSDKISLPPDFNRLVKERKEKNPFGATVTIYEFDEGSFVIENSNGQWERYDTLEEAKSNAS